MSEQTNAEPKLNVVNCLCEFVVYTVIVVYFGVYAFSNPDLNQQMFMTGKQNADHCFYNPTTE